MQQLLQNLRDVPGVIGSFILNNDGALVGHEMPAYVGAEIYPDIGRRLATAFGALDSSVAEFDDLLLKFDEQWLYVRRLSHGMLSILSTASVNFPALRMATNIAATKVDAMIPQAAVAAPQQPVPAAVPAVTPAPATPQPAAPAPRRFWRGQAVD